MIVMLHNIVIISKASCLRRRNASSWCLYKEIHFPSHPCTQNPSSNTTRRLHIPLSLCSRPIFLQTPKKMNCLQTWSEPIVRVQSLAESGIRKLPNRYIKPPNQRPQAAALNPLQEDVINIPVISLQDLFAGDESLRKATLASMSSACREWGFFQVVNHGVDPELMKRARDTWREFFEQPVEEKQRYANSPDTYEGYGSRLGVQKGALLDWSDYFFLHLMPPSLRRQDKWPSIPNSCRYNDVTLFRDKHVMCDSDFSLFLPFCFVFIIYLFIYYYASC